MPAIVKVTEELITVRERNRNAGNSYGARTAEVFYTAHFDDGTTDADWYLHPTWKPFLETGHAQINKP